MQGSTDHLFGPFFKKGMQGIPARDQRTTDLVGIFKGKCWYPRTAESVQIFTGESRDLRTNYLVGIFKGDEGVQGSLNQSEFRKRDPRAADLVRILIKKVMQGSTDYRIGPNIHLKWRL